MLLRSFILTGAVNGLFFILLLLTKERRSGADKLLSFWMGLIAVQLFFYYDNLFAQPVLPINFQIPFFATPLISSAVLYFYIKQLAFGEPFNWKSKLIHLLPYLLFNLGCFYIYYTGKNALVLANGFPHFSSGVNKSMTYILTGLLALIPGYYSFAALFLLLKYQKVLPDNYSFTERISLNWLKWMVIALLTLFTGLFILIKYGRSLGWVDHQNLFAVVGAILTLYVFFIGFLGFRQQSFNKADVQSLPVTVEEPLSSYKNSGLNEARLEELYNILVLHMVQQQPYLEDTLTLRTLAMQLNITPNQLSQVINQKTESNFFTFINSYRVEEVKTKLTDPAMAHYSILSIAFDCGFRSKSAFNKIFKEATGLTPAEYQNTANNKV
ncbi:helix-turn-helix domain-containing protein [Mucilaginibacter terrae]|uniref:helix-turn-helix domain-containing protein n=1 Tax=Mucilaginibacter terrae TaxID=1955052 RepID=UPI003636FEFE